MEAQRDELLKLVAQNGWKATKLNNYDFRQWSMETWLLQSLWSPVDAEAYVSFLIDPQSDFQNPYAWAVEVSNEKPIYGKERNHFVVSLKQWKNEKNGFLQFLEDLRNEQKRRI